MIAALRHWLLNREGTSSAGRTEKKIVNFGIQVGKKLQIAALRHWLPKREGTSSAGRTAKQLSELLSKQRKKIKILYQCQKLTKTNNTFATTKQTTLWKIYS